MRLTPTPATVLSPGQSCTNCRIQDGFNSIHRNVHMMVHSHVIINSFGRSCSLSRCCLDSVGFGAVSLEPTESSLHAIRLFSVDGVDENLMAERSKHIHERTTVRDHTERGKRTVHVSLDAQHKGTHGFRQGSHDSLQSRPLRSSATQ
jgi:hypothetical protein